MSKVLYNFFVEQSEKDKAGAVLNKACGRRAKGMIAAFLRVNIQRICQDGIGNEELKKVIFEYEQSNEKKNIG